MPSEHGSMVRMNSSKETGLGPSPTPPAWTIQCFQAVAVLLQDGTHVPPFGPKMASSLAALF